MGHHPKFSAHFPLQVTVLRRGGTVVFKPRDSFKQRDKTLLVDLLHSLVDRSVVRQQPCCTKQLATGQFPKLVSFSLIWHGLLSRRNVYLTDKFGWYACNSRLSTWTIELWKSTGCLSWPILALAHILSKFIWPRLFRVLIEQWWKLHCMSARIYWLWMSCYRFHF